MCLAIPGQIETVDESAGPLARTGSVSFVGVRRPVNLSLTPEAGVGDFVLVHVGIAIQTIDAAEARRTLALLEELGQLAELEREHERQEEAP